jgi:hypothetical protein
MNPTTLPRVIQRAAIDEMPRLEFRRGCTGAIFISRERDDARFFYQGLGYYAADMDDFEWEQAGWDETQWCLLGRVRVKVTDGFGGELLLEAAEGECIYLPVGFTYTIQATGVASVALWTAGPSLKAGLKVFKDVGVGNAPAYAETLRSLRQPAPTPTAEV